MYPELFHVGSITIYSYGSMIALGLFLAGALASRKAAQIQFSPQAVFDLMIGTALAGIIGARILYIAENFAAYAENPLDIFRLWQGGLVFHGGMATSTLYVWIFAKRNHKSFLELMDFLVPYVALAHGFGRIGCFLNGCCYGGPFSGKWAAQFPQVDGTVHPTQIYSAVVNFALFLFLIKIGEKKNFRGQVMTSYFILYSAVRFVLEYFRGDKPHEIFSFATEVQLLFIFVFAVSVFVYVLLRYRKSN